MANDDKFSLYDTKADINDMGVGSSLSKFTDTSRDTLYLEGNKFAKRRSQALGVSRDSEWKGPCQAEGCSQKTVNRWGQEGFTNKATHLVTSMNDGEVSMKKVCGKHADESHFTAQSQGHNLLTGPEQASGVDLTKPTTIVARLTRKANDTWRVHNGMEPETKTNIDGSGKSRKIKPSTPTIKYDRTDTGWVPAPPVTEEVEKSKGGRPVGSGDSKPRKRRIPISEIRGDADKPKRGRGRPAGTKNNPDGPKRKKKEAAPPITRMVNGREMTVTIIPENKRATEKGMRLTRRTRPSQGSGTAV